MAHDTSDLEREALAFCNRRLSSDAGARARGYLTGQRSIAPSVLQDFSVGLYEAERLHGHLSRTGFAIEAIRHSGLIRRSFRHTLVFPWFQSDSRIGGLVFRELPYSSDVPFDRFGRKRRYAFTGNRDALGLYGLGRALAGGHRKLAIIEGTIALLALRSCGIGDVVAANSCQIRVWHALDLLQRGVTEVTLCLDGDTPGRRGTLRSIEACMAVGLAVRVARPLPAGSDPDDLVRVQGSSAFRRLVEGGSCGLTFMAERILDGSSEARPGLPLRPPSREEALTRAARFCALRAPNLGTHDLELHFWPTLVDRSGIATSEIAAAVEAAVKEHIEERRRRMRHLPLLDGPAERRLHIGSPVPHGAAT